MKIKFLKRAMLGIPLGIAIGNIMSILISVIIGKGIYYVIVPELSQEFGNELNAVIIQTILFGIIGMIYAGFSVVWEKKNWSLIKQTLIVFIAYLVPMLTVGNILKWFEFNVIEMLIFTVIFIVIFVIIWIIVYLKTKKDVDKFNNMIKNNK